MKRQAQEKKCRTQRRCGDSKYYEFILSRKQYFIFFFFEAENPKWSCRQLT